MNTIPSFSWSRLWPTIKRLFSTILRPSQPTASSKASFRTTGIVLAIAFAISLLIMASMDERTVRWAANFSIERRDIRALFGTITVFGKSIWALVLFLVIAVAFACNYWSVKGFGSIRRRFAIYADANYMIFTAAMAGGFSSLTKNLIGRARPQLLDEYGAYFFNPATFQPDFASYPSGHSATFGTLAVGLALIFPAIRWPLVILGLIGGLSRIMVGAHYPSDVVAGLAFGAGIAFFNAHYLANRRLMFEPTKGLWPKRHR